MSVRKSERKLADNDYLKQARKIYMESLNVLRKLPNGPMKTNAINRSEELYYKASLADAIYPVTAHEAEFKLDCLIGIISGLNYLSGLVDKWLESVPLVKNVTGDYKPCLKKKRLAGYSHDIAVALGSVIGAEKKYRNIYKKKLNEQNQ